MRGIVAHLTRTRFSHIDAVGICMLVTHYWWAAAACMVLSLALKEEKRNGVRTVEVEGRKEAAL